VWLHLPNILLMWMCGLWAWLRAKRADMPYDQVADCDRCPTAVIPSKVGLVCWTYPSVLHASHLDFTLVWCLFLFALFWVISSDPSSNSVNLFPVVFKLGFMCSLSFSNYIGSFKFIFKSSYSFYNILRFSYVFN
jgi:hypothetical protein